MLVGFEQANLIERN